MRTITKTKQVRTDRCHHADETFTDAVTNVYYVNFEDSDGYNTEEYSVVVPESLVIIEEDSDVTDATILSHIDAELSREGNANLSVEEWDSLIDNWTSIEWTEEAVLTEHTESDEDIPVE